MQERRRLQIHNGSSRIDAGGHGSRDKTDTRSKTHLPLSSCRPCEEQERERQADQNRFEDDI